MKPRPSSLLPLKPSCVFAGAPYPVCRTVLLRVCVLLAVCWLGALSSASALGLLVVKGANASPEFARVVPFTRCEEFAVNYKVQVTGGGERVYLINEVFGMVEYDPALLAADMVDVLDEAALREVVARTEALAAQYPVMKQESGRFLKPVLEVLELRAQGMVQYQGRWMTRAAYNEVLAERRQQQKEVKAMAEQVERTRRAELARREAEAKAMAEAAARRSQEEEKAAAEAENARLMAARNAEAAAARDAEARAEMERARRERLRAMESNLEALAKNSPAGTILKAEWETLAGWSGSGQEVWAGFELSRAAEALLTRQHFPSPAMDIPLLKVGESELPVKAAVSRDQTALMLLTEAVAGQTRGCVLAFVLPTDAEGRPVPGGAAQELANVVGDVSQDVLRVLPRALATSLTSLPRAGALSRRSPFSAKGVQGYVAVSRPLLGDDGSYHLVAVVALGFHPKSDGVDSGEQEQKFPKRS